jgi:hypothetical protein
MKKYYLQNMYGHTEEAWFNNDNEAFECTVKRNRNCYEGWKAYDERGNLIYGLCICRLGGLTRAKHV